MLSDKQDGQHDNIIRSAFSKSGRTKIYNKHDPSKVLDRGHFIIQLSAPLKA